MSDTELSVGVVGLGKMGGNMARCLVDAGFSVTVFDVREAAVEDLVDHGAVGAKTPRALADDADVVVTSLPNPDIVETVYLDDDGLLAAANEGLTCVEMSTIDPNTTRVLADAGREVGVDVVDAPVEGGPEDCRAGTLVILGGGEPDAFKSDPVQTILEALSDKIYDAGGVGAGHTMKLLNNTMSLGNLLLSMEVAAMGAAYGVKGEAMMIVLRNTGGASNAFTKRIPRVLNRNFEPGFTVDYGAKDLGLTLDMAESAEIPLFVSSLVQQFYRRASTEGLGDEDVAAVVKLFEETAGATVEADSHVDESFQGYS